MEIKEAYLDINLITTLKQRWYKISYVKWVFDKFHLGHNEFLHYIKRKITYFYGEKVLLIVGLESDRITTQKKWKNRPYETQSIRAEKVFSHPSVDFVYVSDNQARYLLDEIKNLQIDYFVVPEEYLYHLKLFFLLKSKLKKYWVKLVLSRHSQYERFGLNQQLASIHTTNLAESNFLKIFVKHIKHTVYLTKELLYFLLKN